MNIHSSTIADQNIRPAYGELVNDIHSRLNPTLVKNRIAPNSLLQLAHDLRSARSRNEQICISGGRHAMGGQQFLKSGLLLDMTDMRHPIRFDYELGLIEAGSGIMWPDLIAYLKKMQFGKKRQWSIAQKQTGCDRLSIGGALSSNVHGRGLSLPPIVANVENFTLVMHDGEVVKCSRSHNSELFKLVIGGYGLFGIIASATLRLVPRTLLRRTVELADANDVIEKLETHTKSGAVYGDYQFAIDHNSPDFLQKGILSTYAPVAEGSGCQGQSLPPKKLLSLEEWQKLLYLAHCDKSEAFNRYKQHYLSTSGQLYWSDTFQLATYIEGYHRELDAQIGSGYQSSELITELYVPREALGRFLQMAADLLRHEHANVIYGTVRLIERDSETFLPWAKERWACIVLNLHVEHTPHAIAQASRVFCHLIDLAVGFNGSYYLTYHRFASRKQLLTCYPEIRGFLQMKAKYDPGCLFSSDWFEHNRTLVSSK